MSISSNELFKQEIENRIFTIRGKQVMLDMHLAELYNVEVKVLNQAVKRNPDRFPDTYFFQLSETEWEFLRSQFVTLKTTGKNKPGLQSKTENRGRHRKYLPYAFTEQGVAMLSAVLRSETAVKVSIRIIDAFIEMELPFLRKSESLLFIAGWGSSSYIPLCNPILPQQFQNGTTQYNPDPGV